MKPWIIPVSATEFKSYCRFWTLFVTGLVFLLLLHACVAWVRCIWVTSGQRLVVQLDNRFSIYGRFMAPARKWVVLTNGPLCWLVVLNWLLVMLGKWSVNVLVLYWCYRIMCAHWRLFAWWIAISPATHNITWADCLVDVVMTKRNFGNL